jgi:GTP cyclohydrolase II
MQNQDPVTDARARRQAAALNGDRAALAVDRAIGELRRGRAIAVFDAGRVFVFAVVETIGSPYFRRLIDVPGTRLVLTAERARAGGFAPHADGPMTLELEPGTQLDTLNALAGIPGTAAPGPAASDFEPWPGDAELVLAAFGLAKAARLLPALIGFAADSVADESLHRVSLAAILEHAAAAATGLQLISESRVPLAGSEKSRVALYRDEHGGSEHVAVIIGEPDFSGSVPVRLHSACLTGDLLGSLRCDCGEQLSTAVERIAALGGGVLLYLDQEGRSIGLANKLRAYQIQDLGKDTYDADRHLGFSSDERNYDVAAAMLQQLGIARVRLLTNNPRKIDALREHGIDVVDRLPLVASPNAHNEGYLRTKRERAGHLGEGRDTPGKPDLPEDPDADQDRS